MEDGLRNLSSHLSEASSIISSLLESPRASVNQSTSQAPPVPSPGRASSGSINTDIASVLNRARSMISQSTSNGSFSRLNRRERLRATSSCSTTSTTVNNTKKKKEDEAKVFEFVVMDVRGTQEPWTISEDKVILRGLVEIKTSFKETQIRQEIGKATRLKYGMIADTDFEFLRATRRKLTKPVNCGAFDYKQLKLMAGQGSIYLKLKDWIYCVVVDDNNEDENVLMHSDIDSDAPSTSTSQREQAHHEECPSTSTDTSAEAPPTTTSAEAQHDLFNESATPDVVIVDENDEFNVINDTAENIIAYCKEHSIVNPVEILRHFQKVMVNGRALQIENMNEDVEGATNFILVDRSNILETAFEEIKTLKDLRLTLQVQFYGEEAVDYGGPRREFFCIILREIYDKYFDNGMKDHLAEDYCLIGIILALSILQDGKIPQFLEENILTEVFDINSHDLNSPQSCLDHLRLGFKKLGIYQVGSQIPVFVHLLRPSQKRLTFKSIIHLLKPDFSPEGSNNRRFEKEVYAVFLKYLREVASGRRTGLTLASILKFATGADEEPILGFGCGPSLAFYEVVQSFLPTANTCVSCLTLPRPSLERPLPDNQNLFSLYDLAFLNAYFGSR